MTASFDDLADVIRSRRTNMQVDRDVPVPAGTVEQLCELATWAPNHKRTWPWRFASVTGDGRHRLGQAFVDDMVDRGFGDEGKHIKTRTKYARTPTVLVVGCAAHEHPTFHDENRDAVAAGIQNLLLGATSLGLATFWSTPPLIDSPRVLDLCGFEPTDRIIAVIYVGWATGWCEAAARPPADVRHIDR
jgi:nitroreductase